jgi:hypothetical protein
MRIFYQLLHFSSDFVEFCVGNVNNNLLGKFESCENGSVKALLYWRAKYFPRILSTFFLCQIWIISEHNTDEQQ